MRDEYAQGRIEGHRALQIRKRLRAVAAAAPIPGAVDVFVKDLIACFDRPAETIGGEIRHCAREWGLDRVENGIGIVTCGGMRGRIETAGARVVKAHDLGARTIFFACECRRVDAPAELADERWIEAGETRDFFSDAR